MIEQIEQSTSEEVKRLAHKIRFWELRAGEGFTDYFLDNLRFEQEWLTFLMSKGYHELIIEIEEDTYVCRDGTILTCSDQELKFMVNCRFMESEDDQYLFADACLWAEFILQHPIIMEELEEFFWEYMSCFKDYNENIPYGLPLYTGDTE